MADITFNLETDVRARRGEFITVAEWKSGDGGDTTTKEVLGAYAESSAIEFNNDIQTITDVLDITHTDVNKTEPQQSFETMYLRGGSKLGPFLFDAALRNDINKYNGTFTVYIISAFSGARGTYTAVKHEGCTILPVSIGGDGGSYVNMPIEVHYSNNITVGTVDKLSDTFTFTAEDTD